MVIRSVIKSSAYFDSVTLMLVQRDVRHLPGVEEAGAVMGTEANKELLRDAGLLTPEAQAARPDDLILAVRATSDEAAVAAVTAAETLLTQRRGDAAARPQPPPNGGGAARPPGGGPHSAPSLARAVSAGGGGREAAAAAGRGVG